MSQSLTQIAQSLIGSQKKVQLIYAFNGTGKTRLSREFKELIPQNDTEDEEQSKEKVLYYNAFTEDLFYWDNDTNRKLKIQPNLFTDWVFQEQGQDNNIISNFQHYTSQFLTPIFSTDFSEITFSIESGGDTNIENIKISKGEESCFIWSIFYTLIRQVVGVLNEAEFDERETDRFNDLEYVFIDDPVSSLDDTHLIELAVNIAQLIKSSQSELKFIITTHNPLFYNVLFNEFNNAEKKRLEKLNDGTFSLIPQSDDSPFSYHLYLLSELDRAIESGDIQKYHFNFLRNILEKTSTFLGYNKWKELLPEDAREAYYSRIINLSSHSYHHGEEIAAIQQNDKNVLSFLVTEIKNNYSFYINE
jgi:hypothetical protein